MKNKFILMAIIIVISTISMRAVNNMINTTVPLLGKYVLNFSSGEIGILTSLSFLTSFFTTSIINPRLDRNRRKVVFILATFSVILLLYLFYNANIFTIWVYGIISGIAYGFITPNLITSASLLDNKKMAERLLAIYSLSLSLSLVIGPSFETFLLQYFNYREIFLIFIPIAIPLFIFSFNIKFPDVERERFSFKDINKKVLFASVSNVMIYNIPFSILTVFAAIYAIDVYHVSKFLGYFIFVPFFTLSFVTRLVMAIKPFKDLRFPITVASLLTAIGIIILVIPLNFYLVILAMIILGIPHGMIFPMSTIIISRGSDVKERNAINSYFIAMGNIILIIFPTFFGYLIQWIGYRISFSLLIIPVLIFFIIISRKYFNEDFMKI